MRHGRQEAGLDLGGIVHAGRHPVGQQVQQEGLLAGGRVLDQLDQFGGLGGGQGQRRNTEGGAFGHVLTVGLQHGNPSYLVVSEVGILANNGARDARDGVRHGRALVLQS